MTVIRCRTRDSSVVSALASVTRVPGLDPHSSRGKVSVSESFPFAGMKFNHCAILRIGSLPGAPQPHVQGKSLNVKVKAA